MEKSKLRMAVCIYGQPRNFEFCFPSLKKHLLNVYNPDVFICTDSQKNRIMELYNPVAIKIYTQEEINKEIGPRRYMYGKIIPCPNWPTFQINPPNEMNLMFLVTKCNELIKSYEETHGSYDVIVMIRFDIKFLYIQPIIIPKENILYLPRIDANQWPVDKNGLYWALGYANHTCWGTPAVIQLILDTYHWSDEYFKKVGVFCGEIMLKRLCDDRDIKIQHTNVTQMIIRGNKEVPYAWNRLPLSKTHYPQYLDPPLPISGHIPGYEPWIGKQWVDNLYKPKEYFDHPRHEKNKRIEKLLQKKLKRHHENFR